MIILFRHKIKETLALTQNFASAPVFFSQIIHIYRCKVTILEVTKESCRNNKSNYAVKKGMAGIDALTKVPNLKSRQAPL